MVRVSLDQDATPEQIAAARAQGRALARTLTATEREDQP